MGSKTKALSDQQRIAFLHYCQWAGLSDHERHVLTFQVTGMQSVARTCKGWTDHAYDRLMCAIEGELEERVEAETVPEPVRWQDHSYWRRRTGGGGEYLNSRQEREIRELWAELAPRLPADCQVQSYLAGIMRKACGIPPGKSLARLSSGQAALVIDALRRRLAQAAARAA